MARNGTNAARRNAKEAKRQADAQAAQKAARDASYSEAFRNGCERLVALNPGLTQGQAEAAVRKALACVLPGQVGRTLDRSVR